MQHLFLLLCWHSKRDKNQDDDQNRGKCFYRQRIAKPFAGDGLYSRHVAHTYPTGKDSIDQDLDKLASVLILVLTDTLYSTR